MQQLHLPAKRDRYVKQQSYQHRLVDLLSEDLDFHNQDGRFASHNFHAFPAKFPPQLPQKFITALTEVGDTVLDPILGSGTTVLEAFLARRKGIGFDIDPLALRIAQVKVTPLDVPCILRLANTILTKAQNAVQMRGAFLQAALERRWDEETRSFVAYWFTPDANSVICTLKRNCQNR
jgi:hypothetical protein